MEKKMESTYMYSTHGLMRYSCTFGKKKVKNIICSNFFWFCQRNLVSRDAVSFFLFSLHGVFWKRTIPSATKKKKHQIIKQNTKPVTQYFRLFETVEMASSVLWTFALTHMCIFSSSLVMATWNPGLSGGI